MASLILGSKSSHLAAWQQGREARISATKVLQGGEGDNGQWGSVLYFRKEGDIVIVIVIITVTIIIVIISTTPVHLAPL